MTMTVQNDVSDVIRTEQIDSHLKLARRAPTLLGAIAWGVSGTEAPKHVFGRVNPISVPAGTLTEGNSFTTVAVTTGSEDIQPGVVGLIIEPTRHAQTFAQGVPRRLIDQAVVDLRDRLEKDALLAPLSSEEEMGNASQEFDLAYLSEGIHAWQLLNPDTQGCLVLHPDALKDLRDSIRTTAASVWGNAQRFSMFSAVGSFVGELEGMPVFCTSNVALDTDKHANFITGMNPGGGGQGVSGIGVWTVLPISVEMSPQPESFSDRFVCYYYAGTGLTCNPDNGQANLLTMYSRQTPGE